MANFYETLGVAADADADTIAAAYAEAERAHGGEVPIDVKTAWLTISNPQTRAMYDKRLSRLAEPSGPTAPPGGGYIPPPLPGGPVAPGPHPSPPGSYAPTPAAMAHPADTLPLGGFGGGRPRGGYKRVVAAVLVVAVTVAGSALRIYSRSERRERALDSIDRVLDDTPETSSWMPGSCVLAEGEGENPNEWLFLPVSCDGEHDGRITAKQMPPAECPVDTDIIVFVNGENAADGELCVTLEP